MDYNYKRYKRIFLPSGAWLVAFVGIILALIVYFIVTEYSDTFVATSNLNIFAEAQNDFFTHLLVYTPWVGWIDRSFDFLFWGAIAAIGMVIAWAVSATRVSITNHKIVQESSNFRGNTKQWNKSFAVALAVRSLLVFIALYMVGTFITKRMPNLSSAIALLLREPGIVSGLKVLPEVFFSWMTLVVIASCIKAFRRIEIL